MAKEILILGQPSDEVYDAIFFVGITPVTFRDIVRVRAKVSELPVLATEILTQPQLDLITNGSVLWDRFQIHVAPGTPLPEAVESVKRKYARWAQRAEEQWVRQWARTETWVNV